MPATIPGSLAELARQAAADFPHITVAYELVDVLLERHPHLRSRQRTSLRYACSEAIKARDNEPQVAQGIPVEPTANGKLNDETKGNARTIESVQSDTIRTLDDLLDACQVNRLEWDVERHTINKWDVTMSGEGGPVVATNWQVKATLVPCKRLTELTIAEIAKELAPLVKREGAAFRPKRTEAHEDYMLELDIFDLHLGKKADPLETGEEYNLDIACALYDTAVDTLLHRASAYPIGTVLLPVGNDFYNSDTMVGSTTKGTPQHEDARWQRTFVRGTSLIVAQVNKLRNRGLKVKLVMVPGNHDYQSVFYLGQVLAGVFAGCDDVQIDNSFPPRKYVQFHDCAVMYAHGNEEKEANLAQIFAQEQPHIWAATRFREVHLAHVHHKKEFKYRTMGENIGLTVRYMRSLSAADAWHYAKGYVGSQRSAEGFVWAKGEGVVAHLTYTYSPENTLTKQAA